MKAKSRNESGLHCRFCNITIKDGASLYETTPKKGIVCKDCLNHLKNYVKIEITEEPISLTKLKKQIKEYEDELGNTQANLITIRKIIQRLKTKRDMMEDKLRK